MILITNDDGIHSPGLAALETAMSTLGEWVTVAPAGDNSAVSQSLTMNRPLRLTRHAKNRFDVNGTPTDTVILGLSKVVAETPALVVSGFNLGPNLGDDINYSGTVSAATEAAMKGIPAIAFSCGRGAGGWNFDAAIAAARRIASHILADGLPAATLLNVNIPDNPNGSISLTRQGRRRWSGDLLEVIDPKGTPHYWIGSGRTLADTSADSDISMFAKGSITITPIRVDRTDDDFLTTVNGTWWYDD